MASMAGETKPRAALDAAAIKRRRAILGIGTRDDERLVALRPLLQTWANDVAAAFVDALDPRDEATRDRWSVQERPRVLALGSPYVGRPARRRVNTVAAYLAAGLDAARLDDAFDASWHALESRLRKEARTEGERNSLAKVHALDRMVAKAAVDDATPAIAGLLEASEDASFTFSIDGRILEANAAMASLAGTAAHNLLGVPLRHLLAPPLGSATFRVPDATSRDVPARIIHANGFGQPCLLDVTPRLAEDGSCIGFLASARTRDVFGSPVSPQAAGAVVPPDAAGASARAPTRPGLPPELPNNLPAPTRRAARRRSAI